MEFAKKDFETEYEKVRNDAEYFRKEYFNNVEEIKVLAKKYNRIAEYLESGYNLPEYDIKSK